MEIKDLIPGNIYHISEGECYFIFRYTKQAYINGGLDSNRVEGDYGVGNFRRLEFTDGDCWITNRNLRNATPQEEHWLNECISKNKLIPEIDIDFSNIKPNYEIY